MEMHYEQIDRSFARIPTMSMQINNQSQFHRRLNSTDFFLGAKRVFSVFSQSKLVYANVHSDQLDTDSTAKRER